MKILYKILLTVAIVITFALTNYISYNSGIERWYNLGYRMGTLEGSEAVYNNMLYRCKQGAVIFMEEENKYYCGEVVSL